MTAPSPIKAIVFDAYGTLFDVYSVGALAEQFFPGKGVALAALWRDKQIEYTRIRTLSSRYKPFWEVTQDALVYSAAALGLKLADEERSRLMSQYACLSAFPENLPALKELKTLGLPLAILSNGTRAMLDIAVKSSGMTGLFDHILSVEMVQMFKTAPEVYQLGPETFGLPAKEILFVSANGWDACAATWYGYSSFWINRSGLPAEQLDVTPTGTGHRLSDVVGFVKERR